MESPMALPDMLHNIPINIPDNASFIEKEWKSRGQNLLAAKLGKSHFNPLSIGVSIDLP